MKRGILNLKQQDRIGWIGLGEMGFSMASNLHRYLASIHLSITVWNRTPAKSAKMRQHGVRVADSLEDLVAQSNIIFTSLANDAAVEEVYSRLIDLAAQVDHSIIFVETSTIYPTLATGLSKQISALQKHTYLQCPVFGRPSAAKAAKLIWVTSGDEKVIQKMCLYFTTMSKSIIHLRTADVAKASKFKLVGNFFVVGSMELLAEGLTLAEKAEVGQENVLKFIETFFPAPSWLEYSRKMVEGTSVSSKDVGFSVELGLKDVGHMRQLAWDSDASLPTADLAHRHLKALKDQGAGDQDWSSLINSLRSASKLPPVGEMNTARPTGGAEMVAPEE